jgi:hypothetical protein
MTKMCCVCRRVEQKGRWYRLTRSSEDELVSHGYCPECFAVTMTEIQRYIDTNSFQSFGPANLSTSCNWASSCA